MYKGLARGLRVSLRGDDGAPLSIEMARATITPKIGRFELGLVVEQHEGGTWCAHNSANEGYRCVLLASTTTSCRTVVMTNDDGMSICTDVMAGAAQMIGPKAISILLTSVHHNDIPDGEQGCLTASGYSGGFSACSRASSA